MGLHATLAAFGLLCAIGLASAWVNARRGIGRWSLIPWDWLMVAALFGALMLGARMAALLAG